MACFKVPCITLNNGCKIPQLGLGTWKGTGKKIIQTIQDAIGVGYRHIDCALFYQNENDIGDGLCASFAKKQIRRGDLFITGKLWNTHHRPDFVQPAIKQTLRDLKINYLNLYLMHWPMAYQAGEILVPRDKKGKMLYDTIDFRSTWKAMEKLVSEGFTQSIGVANFNCEQLSRLLEGACIAPVVNQVECHPYLNQREMMKFCASHKIVVTCYSPLGSPDRPWGKNEPVLLQDRNLIEIAKRHKKSPAQIALKYQIQRCNVVIPKSSSIQRLQENICIFDFELCPDEMECINSLDIGMRYVLLKGDRKHPEYPFNIK